MLLHRTSRCCAREMRLAQTPDNTAASCDDGLLFPRTKMGCFSLEQKQALEGMKHPLTQQGKPGPAVHRSFEQFQFRDVAFHRTIALLDGEPGDHRRLVLLEAGRKALELLDWTGSGLFQPLVQAVPGPVVQQVVTLRSPSPLNGAECHACSAFLIF